MPADPRLLLRDCAGTGLYFVRVTAPSKPPMTKEIVTDGPYLLLTEAIAEAQQAMAAVHDGEVAIVMGRGETGTILVRGKEIMQLATRLGAPHPATYVAPSPAGRG